MVYLVSATEQLFDFEVPYKRATIEECISYFRNHNVIQLDTETEGFDPYTKSLICIQLGDSENQYVVEVRDRNALLPFREILEDKSKLFILHNAKFDLRFFLHYGIRIRTVYDTLLAECVLTTGFKSDNEKDVWPEEVRDVSLEACAKKYCGVQLNKEIRGKIHSEGLSIRVVKYAAEDVKYLEAIAIYQWLECQRYDLLETLNLENRAVIAFAYLEYCGIKIDATKWSKVAVETEKLKRQYEGELDAIVCKEEKLKHIWSKGFQGNLFGEEVRPISTNWGSPAQKLKILQGLGLKIESTGDRELQRNKSFHPLVRALIDYTKFNKLATSFGEEYIQNINPVSGRIHCNVWQILATGRISVKEPNLNQIPSKGDYGALIRSCFIPEEGNVIVGGDYSGMELRIIAEFSQDPLWVKAFKEGKDLHSILASATFDIPETDVKKPTPFKPDLKYRDVQKIINFGLAYGMTEYKLSDTMQIAKQKAKQIIDKFFGRVPKVKAFLDELGAAAVSAGYIRTGRPFRRIRWFPRWSRAKQEGNFIELGNIERAGKNTPIQGTNGDIIKYALAEIVDIIYDNNLPIKILLSVYDEIRTECPEQLAEWWKGEMNRVMVESAQVVIKTVPIEVDCKVSECWEK